MKKEIHLRINTSITNEVESRAKLSGCTNNEMYESILKIGLDLQQIVDELKLLTKSIDKSNSNYSYSNKLLEQIYVDLNLPERDMASSDKLKKFKDSFRKNKNRLND